MKKEIILMLLLLLSCVNVEEALPENLIGEEKMADLIFELAVLDAAKGFVPKDQKERIELDADSFICFTKLIAHSLQVVTPTTPNIRKHTCVLSVWQRQNSKI